jgi:hypothetical protein
MSLVVTTNNGKQFEKPNSGMFHLLGEGMKIVLVKDHEKDIYIAVETGPSVFDPAHVIAAVGRAYRIVATLDVLQLVPLSSEPPVRHNDSDVQRLKEKQEKQ